MSTCHRCGGEIEFRWMNGSLRPLHVSGGCSSGYDSDGLDHIRTRFSEIDSYLNPNARCPKCNKPVFFYRSPHNGRVFFDDVGWPWPKHGCFISADTKDEQIPAATRGTYRFHLRDRAGNSLEAWTLSRAPAVYGDGFIIELKGRARNVRLALFFSQAELSISSAQIADLEDAPAIILPKKMPIDGQVNLSFMCSRLGVVIHLNANIHG